MKRLLLLGIPLLLLLLAAIGFWVWWNRPVRTEMTLYVPAETLVYLEAESLPELAAGLSATDAWRALGPPAGLAEQLKRVDWLSQIPFYTGLGGSEAVVFSRAQIGVAVLGFETSEMEAGFKVKPQVAIVIATHSAEKQAAEVSEKLTGEFARQNLAAVHFDRLEREGASLLRWSSADGVRTIYSTAEREFVILGNDETAVTACLQTIRGQRQNLAENEQLKMMRRKLSDAETRAFGYVSPVGLARLVESLARAYIEKATDQRAQGLAASLLPQLSGKILGPGGAGWSARFAGGGVEDRYLISLQPGITNTLREAQKAPAASTGQPTSVLPRDTYQVTTYLYAEPASAWRMLNSAVTARLDALSAVIVTELLKESLQPYGVTSPNDFLGAAGPAPTVARIDDAGASTVTVVIPEDEAALRQLVNKRLGARARSARVGEAELIVSANSERGAASFVDGFLLIGPEEALRRCLSARARGETLTDSDGFRRAQQFVATQNSVDSATYTDEREAARDFVAAFIQAPARRASFRTDQAIAQRLGQIPYAVTLTRFTDDGLERTTRSAFGQFGLIASQLTPQEK